ncbi:MAG: DUF4037 domain-containing protein [Desulfosalsimonadaceae bacterium]
MKGLELSETYFQQVGLPMLREKFADYIDRIAVGLVGDGSECFGFDDSLSRDHDWGPGFCIWLTREDHQIIGSKLKSAVAELPQSFAGFGPRKESQWGDERIGVFEISQFYRKFTGFDHLPSDLNEWLLIPENNLAACTNGKVFFDPMKELTGWRKALLDFYPEDVRLKKIAARCMTIGQSGQYNFPRCVQRGEYFAAQYAETKFCADFMSLIFLLNKKYVPFYKWMHRAVKSLQILGEWTHRAVASLISESESEEKIKRVEGMCATVIKELIRQGLSDIDSSFMPDHGPTIQNRIVDNALREQNVWVG